MPKRNEKIETGSTYWVWNEDGEKGYRVFSKVVLDKLIAEGKITEANRVCKATSITF
jgi:hypothetical protein